MDCPTCGLTNPATTLKCDCEHDFEINTPTEVPGWEVKLAWRQKVAAYWSICWRAMVVTFCTVLFTTLRYELADLNRLGVWLEILVTTTISYFRIQAILVHRLELQPLRQSQAIRSLGLRTNRIPYTRHGLLYT